MRNLTVIPCCKFESVNYDSFKIFATNRYCGSPNQEIYLNQEVIAYEKRLKHIMNCMREFGKEKGQSTPLFDSASPILVVMINEELYIVDGQHRLMAAKELNIPFFYEVIPEIRTITEAESYFKRFNSLAKKWDKLDNLASLARSGDKNAEIILTACNYFNLPINVVIYFADRSGHKIESFNKKRNYDSAQITELCKLDILLATYASQGDEIEAFKLAKNRDFHHAIYKIYCKYSKDEITRICNHVRKNPFGVIKGTTSSTPYLSAFGVQIF